MNALLGEDMYDVGKMLSFALSDGDNQHRKGWGMLSGDTKWGGRDVGGLIGSITDGGGYAFLGNGLWTLASLSPVPRYAPAYSKAIAKWVYSVASATKYYYADTPGLAGQSNPHDHWDKHALVVSPAQLIPPVPSLVHTC